MSEPITFYDIPGKLKGTAWSGNTFKTRFTLNVKGLPYQVVWVEYPDIARTCQELGVGPTCSWPDGSPQYTLPVIYDPSTKTAVAESGAIGRYLDATYPDTLRVFPEGTEALQEATVDAFDMVMAPMPFLVMPIALQRMNDASKEHFKDRRETVFGENIEEWSPPGSAVRAEQWKKLQAGFAQIARWMGAGGKERRFFMGDTITFADIALAGRLMWMKRVLDDDSEEWKNVERWHGGRWARLIEVFEWL
ncbi:glutathione transferase FuA class [Trametes sanguinea]|nr:glutathione transferase FuA class [Trametes sanguinea]